MAIIGILLTLGALVLNTLLGCVLNWQGFLSTIAPCTVLISDIHVTIDHLSKAMK